MKALEVVTNFNRDILPLCNDKVEANEAFNNYTDMLCKDGDITEELYETITRALAIMVNLDDMTLYSYTSDTTKLDDYKQRGYHIMSMEEASEIIEANNDKHYLANVYRVDEERYYEMLEVLPPLRYFKAKGWSGFYMSELTTSDITTLLARKDDIYVELSVRLATNMDLIANRIAKGLN